MNCHTVVLALLGALLALVAPGLTFAGAPSYDDLSGVRSTRTGTGPHRLKARSPFAQVAAGAGTGLAATAGAWAGSGLFRSASVAALGPLLARAIPAAGASLFGAVASALIQKKLDGKVDWGSVGASTVGSLLGVGLGGGPAGAIIGGVAGSLAWDLGRALWTRSRNPAASAARTRAAAKKRG